MNTNSTDFACLVTGFLTDYLPHHRCYSKNTILSYRDTLKLFLRFIKEEKGILLNSFYIRDFKRELVIEFLEWYRNSGAWHIGCKPKAGCIKSIQRLCTTGKHRIHCPVTECLRDQSQKSSTERSSFPDGRTNVISYKQS